MGSSKPPRYIFINFFILLLTWNISCQTFTLMNIKGTVDSPDVTMTARSKLHCAAKCKELNCMAFSLSQDFVCKMTYIQTLTGSKHRVAIDDVTSLYMVNVANSCNEFDEPTDALILSPTGRLDRVYCTKEFNGQVNGNVLMMLHPETWKSMSTSDITGYSLSTTEVVLFLSKVGGEQKFGIFKQLAVNNHFELRPSLKGILSKVLKVSFVPYSDIQEGISNGFVVNGYETSFTQCATTLWNILKVSAISLNQNSSGSLLGIFGGNTPFSDSTKATDMYSKMTIIANATRKIPHQFLSITTIGFGAKGNCGVYAYSGMDGVTAGGTIGFIMN